MWSKFLFLVSGLLFCLLFCLSFFSKKKNFFSNFECGGEDVLLSYFSFSIQFFMVGLIFIIFDLEVIFLVHIVYELLFMMWMVYLFMIFIVLGLFYELFMKSMSWAK